MDRVSKVTAAARLVLAAALIGVCAAPGHARQIVSGNTPSASCTTPDPFASMGGGTCSNGGWLPPGMTIGGGPGPAPGGLFPQPPVPTSASSCDGPDPYAAMGGGNCYNGFWMPPGMTIGSGPVSCGQPDPFAAMGGGTCYNGFWMPPGMTIGGGPVGCGEPDPFAAMGGGTCYHGFWLPPGMTIGGGPGLPPQGLLSWSGGGCNAPDPFSTIGGGTCYNGGWLPAGMSPPANGLSTLPPEPIFGQSTGGSAKTGAPCTTPDPFSTMGAGTCYNGGWLPPGMTPPSAGPQNPPISCASPDPFISSPGLIGVCVNGGWVPAIREVR